MSALSDQITADAARLTAAATATEAIPTNVAAGMNRSSTTSMTPANESKTFTFTASSAYTPWGVGSRVRAASAAAPTTKWMSGIVTAESASALTMTVDDSTGGSAADWVLALGGEKGATGPTGPMPDLASPGPIGGTTPGAATFTTLNVGGHNMVPGGLFATTGTFSTGGNFATGGTVSTGGTFTTVGNFTAGGAFTTSHAFTTTGGAVTLTLTGTTNVTLPTSGTLMNEERRLRQKRFAVGVSAATISTTNSAWAALITNGSSGATRLHSYFNFGTSTSLAGSKYTFWVEAGAATVVPQAFAGHPFYGLNFAKGLEISFPLQIAQRTSSTAVLPSDGYLSGYFGQSRNTHYEDIVQVGFGFLLKGDGTIQLQALATNGGSVVKSSFFASGLDMSVNASAVASLIRITSDTSGNLTLFVDGVSKCTLSGGPTGLTNVSTSNFSVFTFTISNGAGTPTKATDCTIGEPDFIL